jgi:hypothetical protein
VEVPKDGTMVVNPDKTLTNNLPYVLKYDDPLESDEEVDARDPEDYIEIDAMKPKPDLETEYRRALRHTIREENVLIIHSEETQPDRENDHTGEWTIAHATHKVGDIKTHVVEVHDSKGKWVGDVSPDRATTLLNRFTIATRDPHLRGLFRPKTNLEKKQSDVEAQLYYAINPKTSLFCVILVHTDDYFCICSDEEFWKKFVTDMQKRFDTDVKDKCTSMLQMSVERKDDTFEIHQRRRQIEDIIEEFGEDTNMKKVDSPKHGEGSEPPHQHH